MEHSIGNAIAVLGTFGYAFSYKTKNDLGKVISAITGGSGVSLSVAGLSDIAEGIENMWNGITGNHDKDAENAIKDKLFGGDTASYTAAKLLIISLGGSSALTIYDILTKQPILGIVGGSGAGNTAIGEDLNHVFGKPEHNLNGFLNSYGGNQNSAFNAVQNSAQNTINPNTYITGSDFILNVNGYSITVRGAFVNGEFRIGTFFIP